MAATTELKIDIFNMQKLICVSDFEKFASKVLSENTYEYYKSGADDGYTLAENKNAYKRWFIKPRILIDVSTRYLNSQVLDGPVTFPIGVSPTAMQKLAHPSGELGIVKAVEELGSIYIQSTFSTYSVEELAAAAPRARKWFQLCVFKDRNMSADVVQRAEAAGFEAIVLSVDVPLMGNRRENVRNRYALVDDLELSNLPTLDFVISERECSLISLDDTLDQNVTWEDLKWLKRKILNITKLPVILKGLMSAEDAKIAVEHDVKAIFVSNHGDRQLDSVLGTIDALPAIVKEVAGKCEIYIDGGITTGTDVFKALALGANMVFVGRPALWGLSAGGQEGAKRVLEILRNELDLAMALAGIPQVSDINSACLIRRPFMGN